MKSKKELLDRIEEISVDEDSLIVLKGFSKALVDKEDINIDYLLNNKRKHLNKILSGDLILSYEEFLLFRSSILEMFEKYIY